MVEILDKEASEESDARSIGKKHVLIIEGIRENGSKFRPSDWPERISSSFAVFGRDQRLHYANGVRPKVYRGEKVLVLDKSQEKLNPSVYQQVMQFARDNKLRVVEAEEI